MPDFQDQTEPTFQTEPHFQVPSITAPFQSADAAQRAAEALRQAGFKHVDVDRSKGRPADRGSVTEQPFPESLIGRSSDGHWLNTMDDAVSGFSADELLGADPYLLTVVLDDRNDARTEALRILQQHGANVGINAGLDRSDRRDAQQPHRGQ